MPSRDVFGQPRQRILDPLQQERVNWPTPAACLNGSFPDRFGQGASRLARLEVRGRWGTAADGRVLEPQVGICQELPQSARGR
jgi:hypothetical protein